MVFIYQNSLGPAQNEFIRTFGIIPQKFLQSGDGNPLYFVMNLGPLFSSVFIHGGFFHILGNMWFLWIFGDNVEDRMGHGGFLLFYLLCGVAASLGHIFLNPDSMVPTIGASGAIAGVMGAYFVSYPRARILTLIPIFIFIHITEISAFFFLGIWFLIQFFYGTVSVGAGEQAGGVAWFAHLGGFLAGVVLVFFFTGFRKKN